MLIVESATAILNLITGASEIYVHSAEILITYYGVVDVRFLALAIQDLKLPKWLCTLVLSQAI
jgi:hypothetical protein